MFPIKPSAVKATGNPEVVAMLERWVERAKQGRIGFAVVVMCESPIHAVSDHAGSLELTFAANWGMDTAKLIIFEKMHSRHMVPEASSMGGSDRVCWDATKGPCCFDFIAWLVIAEMNRRRSGAPAPLKIAFRMNDSDEERKLHAEKRQGFYDGVIFPSLAMLGAVQDKDSATAPTHDRYTLSPIVEFAKAGEEVPLLKPSEDGMKAIAEYLQQTTGGQAPVTITLREADNWQYRNSDLTEWLKVAEYLENQGERVIFVRDTAKAAEPITGFQTCPAASIILDMRLALYESAKCNLFVSNGPWYLGLFGSKPWLMFIEVDSMRPCFPETPQFWIQWHGVNPGAGEQFPWSKPDQRVIGKRDSADNIIKAWKDLNLPRQHDAVAEVKEPDLDAWDAHTRAQAGMAGT